MAKKKPFSRRFSKLAWRIDAAGFSDVGCVRKVNQDRYYKSRDRRILVVADGMGAHKGGEVASQLAVDAFARSAAAGLPDYGSPKAVADWVDEALHEANAEIWLAARKKKSLSDMGTTVVVLVLGDYFTHVAHVGDSRAYRLRGNRLDQLTRDHSTAQELIDEGRLDPSDRLTHEKAHEISRWLGSRSFTATHRCLSLADSDVYLLVTDGVTDLLDNSEIRGVLLRGRSARVSSRVLVDAARYRGGHDNISGLLALVA